MIARTWFIVSLLAACGLLAMVSTASAASENRDTFSGRFQAKPGELCDFAYRQVFTVNYTFKELANGGYIEHDHVFVTHTNLATGLTLHEHDRTTLIVNPNQATAKNVGVFWHLRTPTGRLVVVEAGQLTFDTNTGELLRITPHVTAGYAAVICPALGGSPA